MSHKMQKEVCVFVLDLGIHVRTIRFNSIRQFKARLGYIRLPWIGLKEREHPLIIANLLNINNNF